MMVRIPLPDPEIDDVVRKWVPEIRLISSAHFGYWQQALPGRASPKTRQHSTQHEHQTNGCFHEHRAIKEDLHRVFGIAFDGTNLRCPTQTGAVITGGGVHPTTGVNPAISPI